MSKRTATSEGGTSAKKQCLDRSGPATLYSTWSVDDVVDFLENNDDFKEVAGKFEEHEVDGRSLLKLTKEDLKDMGIEKVGVQKKLLQCFESLHDGQRYLLEGKVFNDPIHGHIELHPLMVKIIDTPQFQRLRNIKQLGGVYHVYPGACHNRFEHSIGVGYLAGELIETLKRKQPELNITDKDILCIKIAGLCHDLGHGPFSHLFDKRFIPAVKPGRKWKHEQASVMMFKHLLMENKLEGEFEKYGLDERDIQFITEQIAGPQESEMLSQKKHSGWPYKGRPESKSFMYEIVANKRNGIDVDKWDYFARDCQCLGVPNTFDMWRHMRFVRVIAVNDRKQICTRDKEVVNLYEMFNTRMALHRKAYQHKTSNAIEHMITEALVKANDHVHLIGKEGKKVKMSEAIDDPWAYTHLTDYVVQQILMSTEPELEDSRQLLQQINTRQLYVCIAQTQPTNPDSAVSKLSKDSKKLKKDVLSSLTEEERGDLPKLMENDVIVDAIHFDFGKEKDNPIDNVRFYVKKTPQKADKVRKEQVSRMLPKHFKEVVIRLYCKKRDEPSLKAAKKYFEAWCKKQECDIQNGDEVDFAPYGTSFGTPMRALKEDTQQEGKPAETGKPQCSKALRFPE